MRNLISCTTIGHKFVLIYSIVINSLYYVDEVFSSMCDVLNFHLVEMTNVLLSRFGLIPHNLNSWNPNLVIWFKMAKRTLGGELNQDGTHIHIYTLRLTSKGYICYVYTCRPYHTGVTGVFKV